MSDFSTSAAPRNETIRFGTELDYRGTTRYGVTIRDQLVPPGFVRVAWSSGPIRTEAIADLEQTRTPRAAATA
jgi:hypothetical protein